MRLALIAAAVILVGLGVATLMGEFTYKKNQEVMRLGNFSATAQQDVPVPKWIGIGAIVIGAGLTLVAVKRKS